jgi:hypothetical protein
MFFDAFGRFAFGQMQISSPAPPPPARPPGRAVAPRIPTPKVRTRITPWKSFVLAADPDFESAKRNEPFYEMTGHTFTGDNSKKGPYAP